MSNIIYKMFRCRTTDRTAVTLPNQKPISIILNNRIAAEAATKNPNGSKPVNLVKILFMI